MKTNHPLKLFKAPQASCGSILLVCFFALMMLSLFAITVGYTLRQKMQVLVRVDTRSKLRFLADAGAQKGIYILLRHRKDLLKKYDALNQSWSSNEETFKEIPLGEGIVSISYLVEKNKEKEIASEEPTLRYGLIDEDRKININTVSSAGVLVRLFVETAGLSNRDAQDLANAIWKWKTKSSSNLGGGSSYYEELAPPYKPRFGDLTTLRELLWVKGMKLEIYQKIKPYITLENTGTLNLNTATRPVLLAYGIPPGFCDTLINYRKGRDKKEGTKDDQNFESPDQALQVLANRGFLNDNERVDLETLLRSGVFSTRSHVFSAQVTAQLPYKHQALNLTAFFNDTGVITRWEEEFVALASS